MEELTCRNQRLMYLYKVLTPVVGLDILLKWRVVMRAVVWLVMLSLSSGCGNASYELIKPKKKDAPPIEEPPMIVVDEPQPNPIPVPTTIPTQNPIPTPTPTEPTNPNPIPTPTVPTLPPIPIPNEPSLPPIIVPNPDPGLPFPPVLPPCPGTCPVSDTEILVVVDTSISMRDKQAMVQKNIGIMLNFFRPFPNVRFTLVGGNNNCTEPSIAFDFSYAGARRFNRCVGSTNAIDVLNQALLTPPFSPTARIEAVIISDGNGFGVGNMAANFTYRNPAIVSSVVGIEKNSSLYCFPFPTTTVIRTVCTWEAVGYQYMILSQRTLGSVYDICNYNWTPLLISLYNRL